MTARDLAVELIVGKVDGRAHATTFVLHLDGSEADERAVRDVVAAIAERVRAAVEDSDSVVDAVSTVVEEHRE